MTDQQAVAQSSGGATPLPSAPKVLVVDDDLLDQRIIARYLNQAFEKAVTISPVADLSSAKQRLAQPEAFDFVLIDEALSGDSGLELVRWLPDQPNSPVAILITGDDTPMLEQRAIEAGAWHFIPKGELTPSLLRRTMRFAWSHAAQEQALQTSRQSIADKEAFVSATLDAANAGIITIHRDGTILLANRSAKVMLNMRDQETDLDWPSGTELIDPMRFSNLPLDAYPIPRLLADDPPSGEVVLLKTTRERSMRYLRISGQHVPGADKDIKGVLLMQDVTNQEQSRERAERAGRLEALGQMTGGIAHDFNNILATVLASAEVAQLLPEQTDDSLSAIIRSAKRGAELTSHLLAFARPTNRPFEVIHVAKFLEDIRELALRTMTAESSGPISISLDEVDPALALVCDAAELEHAMLNLIINARDAIAHIGQSTSTAVSDPAVWTEPPGGLIQLSARPLTGRQIDAAGRLFGVSGLADSNYVEVTVSDNGPGMPEHVRRRAIEPFFTTKPLHAGSGLGLALVTSFVDKLGGTLRIYSDEGHGTTIRLMLPVADNAASMASAQKHEKSAPRGAQQLILVVEDEDDLRVMTCTLLQSLGYRTISAVNGSIALAQLTGGLKVDGILTDIIMPGGLSGLELSGKLDDLYPELPVAIMSGYAGADDPSHSRPFIQKPCSHADMARLMASLFKP